MKVQLAFVSTLILASGTQAALLGGLLNTVGNGVANVTGAAGALVDGVVTAAGTVVLAAAGGNGNSNNGNGNNGNGNGNSNGNNGNGNGNSNGNNGNGNNGNGNSGNGNNGNGNNGNGNGNNGNGNGNNGNGNGNTSTTTISSSQSSTTTNVVPTTTVQSTTVVPEPTTTATSSPVTTNTPILTTTSVTDTTTTVAPSPTSTDPAEPIDYCPDVYPFTDGYGCAQQASWGKCTEPWMSGYCYKSCNRCPSTESITQPFNISGLVDIEAKPFTVRTWDYLKSTFGKMVLSGQAETANRAIDAETEFTYLKELTGKPPAVRLFDFMFYSGPNAFDDQSVERAIAWSQRGGIVSFQWHWKSPINGEFYTSNTNFSISQAVTEGSNENTLIKQDLATVVSKLRILQDANVTVLFRPLHEPAGGWFWWGAEGSAPYLQLWDIVQSEITNAGIHNIIWVHNFSGGVDSAWYPGTSKVDFVSIDRYSAAHDYNVYNIEYFALKSLTNATKLIAMAENGPIPDPERMHSFGAMWSYFSTWNSEYILTEQYNSDDQKYRTFNSHFVLNLEDIGEQLKTKMRSGCGLGYF